MPNIIAREKPEVGDEFTVHTNLWARIGSAFSLIFGGKRIGLARVIHDYSQGDDYTVTTWGGRVSNLGKNMARMRVERIFDDTDD